jgi:uncharacterized protein YjbI with pentapeptide repeats
VAIDPKDLGELQKALNAAAGKASVLWTTFITFQLYLAIAFGSVTHRDLFLENSIKLPLLNVDLSLVGFFVVAPSLLLVFHFYLFLQLLGLASMARDYNALLVDEAPAASDRRYLRRRLDVFPILQFLAGPSDQRTGFRGYSLRLIAWITLVATPLLILLQAQVTFLPYHREWIVWLQRVAVLTDLALIWYSWIHLRSDDDPKVRRKAWMYLGGAGTLCVVIFSTYLATFPGEWMKTHLPELRYIPTTWRPSEVDDWTSLQELLFEGAVDEVSGRPRSVFSNRLVLTDQSFVVDPEKLDKITVSRSFRGRDLRLAVLYGADLRKADFTGAQLQRANLSAAQLQEANLSAAQLQGASLNQAKLQEANLSEAQLQEANLSEAQLQEANLRKAQLQGALFILAQLQGASLDGAQLQGASLFGAQLQGASLHGAQLQDVPLYCAEQRASLSGAQPQGVSLSCARFTPCPQLQGASLDGAQLQGASARWAQLQGASLSRAQLQGASLDGAQLQGASLDGAQLQGASLDGAQLQGARLVNVLVWRALGTPNLDLADLHNIDPHQKPWKEEDNKTFGEWRDAISNSVPDDDLRDQVIEHLAVLDPTEKKESEDWDRAHSSQPQGEEVRRKRAMFLADLACVEHPAPYLARGLPAPYVARGLLRNLGPADEPNPSLLDAGGLKLFTDRLLKGKSDPTTCPGVRGLTDTDWEKLSKLSSETLMPR